MLNNINMFLMPSLKTAMAYNNSNSLIAYNGESAGIDLYNASDSARLVTKEDMKVLIPTGIKLALYPGQVALIMERGSITRTPLKVRAGVIDPGYTGEIFVNCVNISDQIYVIEPWQKLPFQMVVTNYYHSITQMSEEDFQSYVSSSSRKEGLIGSSDTTSK